MKILAAAIATLTIVCGRAAAGEESSAKQVVFVCEHGNVKSLMAASYFNQLAAQRGLPWRAVSRGSAPDSTTVPQAIAAALQADGIDVKDFRPAKLDAGDAAGAARIVAIGSDLSAQIGADERLVERWNHVPAASISYDAARNSLKAHIADLLEKL